MLRAASPPSFWLRRVSKTAAGFYMRRLTHGRCGGGGVLRTAPPPPFLGCAVSERRGLVSTCVDARARRGRVLRTSPPPPYSLRRASARRRLVSTRVDARARRGRASHSPASPFLAAPRQRDGGLFYLRRRKGAAGACFAQPRLLLFGRAPRHERETAACFYTRRRTGAAGACFAQPRLPPFSCAVSARRRLVLLA